jgi:hypothetical protein
MCQEDVLGTEMGVQLSRKRLEYGAIRWFSFSLVYGQRRAMDMGVREMQDAYLVSWYIPVYHPTSGSEWNELVIWGIA